MLVSPIYERIFAAQLKPDLYSLSSQEILSEFVEFNELDRQLNYFVLHASFGDKWFILSLIQVHLDYYPASRVIAAATDRGLVELFVGKEVAAEKFIFIEQATLNRLSSYFRPISKVSTQIADSWFAPGCLHTVAPYLLQNGLPARNYSASPPLLLSVFQRTLQSPCRRLHHSSKNPALPTFFGKACYAGVL